MNSHRYKSAVKWIALNDEAGCSDWDDPEIVKYLTTVLMVSDVFELDHLKVALDVIKFRKKNRGV